jgi:hypothetical protein
MLLRWARSNELYDWEVWTFRLAYIGYAAGFIYGLIEWLL